MKPHITQHGTHNEYNNYGCRCDLCRAAGAAYQRRYKSVPCADCGVLVWGRYRPGSRCRACNAKAHTIPLGDLHGTESGYVKKGCRCADCRAAANRARNARRKLVIAGIRDVGEHGKASSYSDGCRCAACREAHRLYHAARRAAA